MARRGQLPGHLKRFTIALALVAVGGGALVLLLPETSGLYLFALYSMPSNSMLPVPHEPGLLYFAKYYDPLYIALAGSVGSAVAAFADYEIVERAFRVPKIASARETKLYRWSVRCLMRYPFWTIVLFAATPLPVYVVRVLAPASGYPVGRYVAAIFLGRLPRFYAIAWVGHLLAIPTWVLLVMFALFVAALYWSGRSKARGSGDDGSGSADDHAEHAGEGGAVGVALAGGEDVLGGDVDAVVEA